MIFLGGLALGVEIVFIVASLMAAKKPDPKPK
jgi:hypothetical protein